MLFAAALLFLILTYIYPDVSYGNCIMELEWRGGTLSDNLSAYAAFLASY
jgi:hypothetical protein